MSAADLAIGAPVLAQRRTGGLWIAPPLLILSALFF
jgi:hypothetical protein